MIDSTDRDILRRLAGAIVAAAGDPVMEERRRLWKKTKALSAERPMVMTETSGVLDEVLPEEALECKGEWARGIERGLRSTLFFYDEIGDDHVIEPRLCYPNVVRVTSDYGVEKIIHRSDSDTRMGSVAWDAPIKDIEADMHKLHFREFEFDEDATICAKEALESVFGGICSIECRGFYWWTNGLTISAIDLIGLEQLMLGMYDQPQGIHQLMAFLRDDQIRMLEWHENTGLLNSNNQDDYIGSGSIGYTDELPQHDYLPGTPARLKDMWGLSESQETVSISADMFEEFVFPYQQEVISRFGLSCYGCCEPLDKRWHVVKQIPNLRWVSVSPWSDQQKMAEYLCKNYVYARKPNPTLVSTEKWDESLIRSDIQETLEVTKGLNVELVMKDVHTLCGEPWRLRRWVEIVRETMDKFCG